MRKLMMTVAIVIGMITATFADTGEATNNANKEVQIKLDKDKLHYSFYSPFEYKGIVVDEVSKLVLKTEDGLIVTLSPGFKVHSQKGYHSEYITVSFDLTDCQAGLLKEKKVVEVRLQHANGVEYYAL